MDKYKVLLNSLMGIASLIANILVAFVMTPVIVHVLGNQGYGLWEMLGGLVGYLGLLDLGMGPALTRYVADAWSRQDRTALERIFNTALLTLTGLGLIGMLVLWIGSHWVGQLLSLESSKAQELMPVLFLFGLNLAIGFPAATLDGYLLGLQKHRFVNLLGIVFILIRSLITYHVLTKGWQPALVWLVFISFCDRVLWCLALAFWILVIDRKVRIKLSAFSMTTMKNLLAYGGKSTVMMASLLLVRRLVTFVIGYTAGIGQIVFYVMPNNLLSYAQSVGLALGAPLMSYFADIAGKRNSAVTRQAWLQATRLLQIVTLGTPLAAAGFGEPFLRIWMGQEYAEHGKWVLYIFCMGFFVQGIATNSNRLLLSLAKHGRLALISAILGPGTFAISIGLGWMWGIEGIAAAVSLCSAINAALEVILACRALGMPLYDHLRATVLRFTLPLTVTAGMIVGLHQAFYPTRYEDLVSQILLASTIYLVTVWLFALNPSEQRFFLSIVTAWLRPLQRKLFSVTR